jgi:hypothetical protein
MTVLFWLAAATLVVTMLAGLELAVGNRSIHSLAEVAPDAGPEPPRVSVIVAARNEERNIREALTSLLRLDYPDYQLLVVDDRSEDATGSILDGMAATDRRLKVIHLEELPAGWLGKNHALWSGSLQADGELLLFTDADIVMEPTLLSRAVAYLQRSRIDHLAVTPAMRMPTHLLGMFGAAFIIFFSFFARPWKARDPRSRCHIGIGAFNLVRSAAYRQVGGHGTIRLRPDDDIKLGKILKGAGLRQEVAYGPEFMAVEWYATLGEVFRGLEKNAFAGTDYRASRVLGGAVLLAVGSIWPFVAPLVTAGPTRWLNLATAALVLLAAADSARFHGSRPWYAVAYPLMAALFIVILLRTMLLNLWQGGIRWRGTFYPLDELRRNRV